MSVPKIVFIVPYRNRKSEKINFSNIMNDLLEDYDKNDYEIYYSCQKDYDGRPFNRGAIKNIGFLTIKKKYPNDYKNITFVFNDVDTYPSKKNMLPFETEKNIIKHFYGFTYALGGIFSIKGEDFEKLNGFPNNWGWGFEDNEINRRANEKNITIDRSVFFPIKSKEIIQIIDNPLRLISNKEPANYIKHKMNDDLNTINNLNYNIEPNIIEAKKFVNQYNINIESFNTLIPHNSGLFYSQDLSQSNRINSNKFKRIVNNRFRMAVNMGR